MGDMTTVTTCNKCGLSYRESLAFPHECAEWTKGRDKKRERFGYVVLTGRHKILDYNKSDGQQIATADNEDAAWLIRPKLIAFLAGVLVGYVRSRHALANCRSQNLALAKDLGNAVSRGVTLETNLILCKENK